MITAAVTVGAILRIRGLFTDFWLDEIWGLRIALEARSGLDLITRIHVDTNHPLILMWMRLIGAQPNWEWYRLPSLLFGAATVVLLIYAAQARVIMAILASLSLPLIVYSSEARGYAAAAALLVAAHVLRSRRGRWAELGFGGAILASFLAHIGAVTVYAGFAAADLARRDVRRHMLPLLGGAALYFVKVRHLIIVGAPQSSAFHSAIAAAAGIFGANGESAWAILPAAVVGGIVLWEIGRRARNRDVEAIFYAVAIVLGPAAGAAATAHRCACVAPRYFFFSVPFVLILMASFIARLPRAAATVVVAAFAIGNTLGAVPFIRYGRGAYLDALTDLSQPARLTTVGASNDFRASMLLRFYSPYLPSDRRIVLVPHDRLRESPPDWFILESAQIHPDALPRFGPYVLEKVYPHGGYSGWTWMVYRRPARMRHP